MVKTTDEILRVVSELNEDQQQRVLAFAIRIKVPKPEGSPGKDLLRFVGCIPKDDIERMRAVIEEDCERIDYDAW
ncbi:MAG TPA: hypothetical protein PKI11_15000 [Candidatus Hydrogenedentes bacterium]|nr:hypothetical protein [Candidatus Hydrogenedentota bacterium]